MHYTCLDYFVVFTLLWFLFQTEYEKYFLSFWLRACLICCWRKLKFHQLSITALCMFGCCWDESKARNQITTGLRGGRANMQDRHKPRHLRGPSLSYQRSNVITPKSPSFKVALTIIKSQACVHVLKHSFQLCIVVALEYLTFSSF